MRLRGKTPSLLGWIGLGASLVLIIAGIVVLGTSASAKASGFHRLPYPEGGEVTLDGTGTWIVYFEYSGSLTRVPFKLDITGPAGHSVPVQYYANPAPGQKVKRPSYNYQGYEGIAIYQFVAATTGSYDLQIGERDFTLSGAYVAVGRDITTSTTASSTLVVSGLLVLVAAVGLLIVGFAKRSRQQNELLGPPDNFGRAPQRDGPPPYGGTLPPPGYAAPPGSGPHPGSPPPGPPPVIR